MIVLTESAKERILLILEGDGMGILPIPEGQVFRIELQGGGCTGFKYNFDVTEREDDDIEIDSRVVTDPMSFMYLDNSTINFKNTIFANNFEIINPQVKTTCGCGESIGF